MARWYFVVLILAGCMSTADHPSPTDSSDSTTTTSSTTTTTVTLEQGLASYQMCLRNSGMDIPVVPLDGLGRPRFSMAMSELNLGDREVLDALDECAVELADGVLRLTADPQLMEMVQSLLGQYAICMREHGVDRFPDPVDPYNGVGSPFNALRVPWDDPALTSAATLCSAQTAQSSR